MAEREKRTFWLADDGVVRQAEGQSCAPENPDYWWFPTLGFSSNRGRATEAEARSEAADFCRAQISRFTALLEKVKA